MTRKTFLTAALGILFSPLFAHAQVTLAVNTQPSAPVATSSADLFTTCSQEAIDARDDAIGNARMAYNTQMSAALDARKQAEKNAIALTDDGAKKDAIASAVGAYKNAFTQAQDTLIRARKDAWSTFEDNINNCRTASKETSPQTPTLKASAAMQTKPADKGLNLFIEKLKAFFMQ